MKPNYLENIPQNWQIKKLKYLFEFQKGKNPKETVLDNKNLPIYLAMDYLRGKPKTIFYVKDLENCVLVEKDDILLLWDGSNAGEFMAAKNGVLSSTMAVLTPKISIDKKFVWFLLKDFEIVLKQQTIGMGIPHVNPSFLYNYHLLLPPLSEQQKIANFLDKKTTELDTLIKKKNKLIKLLQEDEKAFISESVLRGHNHVNLVNSGIEWIGKIPHHWKIIKAKYIATITRGAILRPVDNPLYFDENGKWTYLNISDATKCEKFLYEGKLRLSELGSQKSYRVYENNLILTASATIGKPFINKIKVCVHDGFIVFNDISIYIEFLFYYLKNDDLYTNIGKSNTQKNIYLDEVKNMPITLPPLSEQEKIVSEIENHIHKNRQIIEKLSKEVDLLKEYRQSLISEAVTGQLVI